MLVCIITLYISLKLLYIIHSNVYNKYLQWLQSHKQNKTFNVGIKLLLLIENLDQHLTTHRNDNLIKQWLLLSQSESDQFFEWICIIK